jgi:hypothetical protein
MKIELLAIAALATAASSCYRNKCAPRYELAEPVSEETRQWFPYQEGQRFQLRSNGADTVEGLVISAGEVAVEYDMEDHCPAQLGNGISGSVLLGADTLLYQTGMYPDYLDLKFRGVWFTLGHETISRHVPEVYYNSADSLTLHGRVFPKTVRATLPDSTFAFYLSHGVGVSGLLLDSVVYSLAE